MVLIILAIGVAGCMAAWLLWYGNKGYTGRHTAAGVAGVLFGIFTCISSTFWAVAAWHWMAAAHKVDIINREYKTNYTQAEVFYASNVIDTIRQLDRKRYEINGDLMKK